MGQKTISTVLELGEIARTVLGTFEKKNIAQVVTLSGELGVGKTAFVKELAYALGVHEHITSPTFVIMKSYPIVGHSFLKTLTHIDAYRIESEDEMRVLGLPAILNDPARLVCIEWPERIANCLPEDVYPIALAMSSGDARTIMYGKK